MNLYRLTYNCTPIDPHTGQTVPKPDGIYTRGVKHTVVAKDVEHAVEKLRVFLTQTTTEAKGWKTEDGKAAIGRLDSVSNAELIEVVDVA